MKRLNIILLKLILLISIFFILYFLYYKRIIEVFDNNEIPKIIHQTAPNDKKDWHKDWFECQKTWFSLFPDFEYKMWNDDDIDKLVSDNFPEFYNNTYKNYDKKIKKIDTSRYCMLYMYGGMYVDMDYMCYKNFWDIIPKDKICISESPFTHNEYLQNSLMISKPKHTFWLDVLEEASKRANSITIIATGPNLITDLYNKNSDIIFPLPINQYNPMADVPFNNSMITRQLMTEVWTKHEK